MPWQHLELLGYGALVTAGISLVAILAGLALGIVVCAGLLRPPGSPWRMAGLAYVSFFRGVPLLVMLLLIYRLLPVLGIDVPGIVAAIIGLTLSTAAYQ